MISATEALILGLLMQKASSGAYGSELMHSSDGKLKRGSVYSLLGRLEKAGYVESKEVPGTEEFSMPRTKYKITAAGQTARAEFANWVGLPIEAGVMA